MDKLRLQTMNETLRMINVVGWFFGRSSDKDVQIKGKYQTAESLKLRLIAPLRLSNKLWSGVVISQVQKIFVLITEIDLSTWMPKLYEMLAGINLYLESRSYALTLCNFFWNRCGYSKKLDHWFNTHVSYGRTLLSGAREVQSLPVWGILLHLLYCCISCTSFYTISCGLVS